MICVYPPNCTDFSNNGLGAVRPQSCTVIETLNGEWELTLVHPIDELGKWQRLTEGCILRAPVPAAMTPQINLVTQQYQTTTYDVEIYKISTNKDPLRLRSGTGTKYKILGKYKKGTEVIVLDKTTSSWYEVTCPDGKHGYMSSEYLTYVRTEQESIQTNVGFTNSTIESRQLRDQPFRIYRVVPELNKVTVYARHIFYDLLDNMVKSIKPASDAVGASVVQSISDGCLSEHDFTFYSDLETTAADACVKTRVASRKWTHWFQLPFIDYGDAVFAGGTGVKVDTAETEYTLGSRTLKDGSKGTDVKALQEFLLQLEYSLPKYGADGEFGSETETALKKFQKKAGIKQDGIYGSETHQALILTKSISRFARNMADCVELINQLRLLKVTVFFEKEGLRTDNRKSDLVLNILAALAQEESNSISQNMIRSHEQYVSEGRPNGCVTYGYTRVDGTWKVNPSEARRVQTAFRMAAEGQTYKDILAELNAMEQEENTGVVWLQRRVKNMLRNVAYLGDYYSHGTVCLSPGHQVVNRGYRDRYYIEEHHDPLVSRVVFDRVQQMLDGGYLISYMPMTEERMRAIRDNSWQMGA